MSQTKDHPGLSKDTFKAEVSINPSPRHMTVSGQVTGDYRVESVKLVHESHQSTADTLVLKLETKLGPVQNPHSEIEKVLDVSYKQSPYTHHFKDVKVVDGSDEVTFEVFEI